MTGLINRFARTGVAAAAAVALVGAGQTAQADLIVYDIVQGLGANRVAESGIDLTQQGNDQWWYYNQRAGQPQNPPTHIDDFYLSPEAWSGDQTSGEDWRGWAEQYGWGDRSESTSRGHMLNADWDTVSSVTGTSPGDAILFQPRHDIQTAIEWRAHADGVIDFEYAFKNGGSADGDHPLTRFWVLHWDGTEMSTLADSGSLAPADSGVLQASGVTVREGDGIILYNSAYDEWDIGQGAVVNGELTFIPEPASLGLLGIGTALLVMRRRRLA